MLSATCLLCFHWIGVLCYYMYLYSYCGKWRSLLKIIMYFCKCAKTKHLLLLEKNQLKFWSAYIFIFILLFILLFISHIKLTQTQVTETIFGNPILRIDFGNADSFRALAQDEPPFISVYYAIKSMPEPSIGQVTLGIMGSWLPRTHFILIEYV